MNKTLVILIVSALTLISFFKFQLKYTKLNFLGDEVQVKDCSISQVFLQLGDSYSREADRIRNNDVTISFHTPQECQLSAIEVVQGDSTIVFYYQENVHSYVKGQTFCHNQKLCETVNYDQYIHHFYISLPIQGDFQYTIVTETARQGPIKGSIPSKKRTKLQKIMYFGDLDNTQTAEQTWQLLHKMKNRGDQIDATIFLGDFGYEFYQNNGKQGDLFLQTLSTFSSVWPWMMTPGNHEDNGNWTFYNDKFRSPYYAKSNNHYYSFDIGLVHFISVDLHYYNNGTVAQPLVIQKEFENWLSQDLIAANANRANVPWIIVFGHKAVYCVSSECNDFSTQFAIFDDLFYNNGVDLFIAGHRHQYQFLKPLHKNTILTYKNPDANTVIDPAGPIYVIQGNGGNTNMASQLEKQHDEYLITSDTQTGIGMLTVHDANHIEFEYIRASTQQVFDTKHLYVSKHKTSFALGEQN